jgi:hypothetical protein
MISYEKFWENTLGDWELKEEGLELESITLT